MRAVHRLALLAALAAAPAAAPAAAQVQMAPLGPDTAAAIAPVVERAQQGFRRMPQVRLTSALADICGADADTQTGAIFCTSLNAIYVDADLARDLGPGAAAYFVAHLFGHALQLRHGTPPKAGDDEALARAEAQADCIAGHLLAASGAARVRLADWFDDDPLEDVHWGADPLAGAMSVSLTLAARDAAFRAGEDAEGIAACSAPGLDEAALARAATP